MWLLVHTIIYFYISNTWLTFLFETLTPFVCLITALHLKLFLSPASRCWSVTDGILHVTYPPRARFPKQLSLLKLSQLACGHTILVVTDLQGSRRSPVPSCQPPPSQKATRRSPRLIGSWPWQTTFRWEMMENNIVNWPGLLFICAMWEHAYINFLPVPVMQHIITQDFARNQDPPSASSASATFQSVVPPVSSSSRTKVPSRYSPENQAPHHQRASSRVSPENAPDKPRARYMGQTITTWIHAEWVTRHLSNSLCPACLDLVSHLSKEGGRWRTMNPSLHRRATKASTNRRPVGLHHRGERLTTLRSGTGSAQFGFTTLWSGQQNESWKGLKLFLYMYKINSICKWSILV